MNKQELIAAIQERAIHYKDSGVTKNSVEAVLDSLADVINGALVKRDEVALPGIGKFSAEERAARKGRNPATGAEIDIAAKRVPKFNAAKVFKDSIAFS
ncbi:HU family DNA-binding protein [Undibacterium sp. Xuan67W]|uniref:HU family DNA-binding protein n=1 Tax=Undibacterium sp. Xuan67W TaxID=3413057 RepID=UPI003BF1C5EA